MNTSEAVPFSCQDAILAFCLYNVGVPEWRPPVNTYNEEIIFTAGGGKKDDEGKVTRRSKYAGLTLWDAAQQAWKEGVRGKVRYWFEKTAELPYFLKAYENQEKECNEVGNDRDGGERIREIMRLAAGDLVEGEVRMDEREATLRILCIGLKGRSPFVNRWRGEVPELEIYDKGHSSRVGNLRICNVDYKTIPLTASEKMKKDLRL